VGFEAHEIAKKIENIRKAFGKCIFLFLAFSTPLMSFFQKATLCDCFVPNFNFDYPYPCGVGSVTLARSKPNIYTMFQKTLNLFYFAVVFYKH